MIEQSIKNIQSVRTFVSDSVQELRRSGDPTVLSKYEDILQVINQEEDKTVALSRQHQREAERKNATIQQLRHWTTCDHIRSHQMDPNNQVMCHFMN